MYVTHPDFIFAEHFILVNDQPWVSIKPHQSRMDEDDEPNVQPTATSICGSLAHIYVLYANIYVYV